MLDMQKLVYFTEGNRFAGSHSGEGMIIRYRVEPDKENEQLRAWCWREDVCFEKARDKAEGRFPLTQDGLDSLLEWLRENWERE